MTKRLHQENLSLVVLEEAFERPKELRLQIDDTLSIDVYFDPISREEGFKDDIRFLLSDSGPKTARLFPADEIGFLLTAEQAEQLAAALNQAVEASRAMPG